MHEHPHAIAYALSVLGPMQAASFLWALSRLMRPIGCPPSWFVPRPWLLHYRPMLQDLAKVAASGMSDLSVLDLVDCAVGCADLSFFPGDEWMDAHETAANARMAELTARQFGLLKQAYGQLDLLYQELAGTGRT